MLKRPRFSLGEVASRHQKLNVFVKFEENSNWQNELGCFHISARCFKKSSSSSRIISSNFGKGTKNSMGINFSARRIFDS